MTELFKWETSLLTNNKLKEQLEIYITNESENYQASYPHPLVGDLELLTM